MRQPPRRRTATLLDRPLLLLHGEAGAALTASQQQASSVAFSCIVAGQIGVAMACRSEHRSAFVTLVQQG